MQQAARQHDATWAVYLGPTPDSSAGALLSTANTALVPATFTNDQGQRQGLFTNLPGQYESAMNGASSAAADPLTLSMYQTYLQPAAANNSWPGGVIRLAGQTGVDVLRSTATGTLRLITGNSGLPSPSNVFTAIGSAFTGAGDNLGSGAAGLTPSGQALLTTLYGRSDAPTVAAIVSTIPAAAMVTGVAGLPGAVGSIATTGSRVVGAVGSNFVRVLGPAGEMVTVARIEAASLPAGYALAADGLSISGPRGGQMQVTGWLNLDGQPVLQQGSSYFTLAQNGTRVEVQAPRLGNSTIEANAARGNAFQTDAITAAGVNSNTKQMTFTDPRGGSYTIVPDGRSGGWLIEVKDAQSVGWSRQWDGYQASRQPIHLIVSEGTRISPQIESMIIERGGRFEVFNPATRTFTPWRH